MQQQRQQQQRKVSLLYASEAHCGTLAGTAQEGAKPPARAAPQQHQVSGSGQQVVHTCCSCSLKLGILSTLAYSVPLSIGAAILTSLIPTDQRDAYLIVTSVYVYPGLILRLLMNCSGKLLNRLISQPGSSSAVLLLQLILLILLLCFHIATVLVLMVLRCCLLMVLFDRYPLPSTEQHPLQTTRGYC